MVGFKNKIFVGLCWWGFGILFVFVYFICDGVCVMMFIMMICMMICWVVIEVKVWRLCVFMVEWVRRNRRE